MRTSHFRTIGTAWRTPIEPAGGWPKTEPVVAAEMPRGQVIALLYTRAGGADSLSSKVLDTMRAMGSDEPTKDDWADLREQGYVHQPKGYGLHALRPAGLFKAQAIVKALAKEYGLHHIEFHAATRSCGPRVTCCCGWSQLSTIQNGNARITWAERHLSTHAAKPEQTGADVASVSATAPVNSLETRQ
jgi:hypothetical protein